MDTTFEIIKLISKDDFSAEKEIWEIIRLYRCERGHGGHTGTLADTNSVELCIRARPKTYQEAVDWLRENCRKRGPVLIVETDKGEYIAGARHTC